LREVIDGVMENNMMKLRIIWTRGISWPAE